MNTLGRPAPPPQVDGRQQAGFTLLEILLAIAIFSMVVGTVYMVLSSSMRSYESGQESIALFQNARAALRSMEVDLRRAVSPAETNWNIMYEDPLEESLEEDEYYEEEPEPEQEEKIIFKGTQSDVRFVMADFVPGGEPPWDLSEVRYYVNSEKEQLIRETTRSVVEFNMMEWRLARVMNENESEFGYELQLRQEELRAEPPERVLVMAGRIKEMKLRYSNGNKWENSWDSQAAIEDPRERRQEEGDEDQVTEQQPEDQRIYKKGLPTLVEVTLTLSNNTKVRSTTEISAAGKNVWYWEYQDDRRRQRRNQ